MKKLNPKILLIAALILSIICGFLIYRYLKKAATPKVVTRQVLVAAVDIQPGTKITEDKVKLINMPTNTAVAGAKSNANGIIGLEVKALIPAGEQITDHKLGATQYKNNNTNTSSKLPKDKRAVTMVIDEMSGVTSYLKPGMYVDVIKVLPRSNNAPTRGFMFIQKAMVISISNNMQTTVPAASKDPKDKNAAKPVVVAPKRYVVLAVDPNDAVAMRVAQLDGSVLSLTVRDRESINDIGDNTIYGDDTPLPRTYGGAAAGNVKVIRGTAGGK